MQLSRERKRARTQAFPNHMAGSKVKVRDSNPIQLLSDPEKFSELQSSSCLRSVCALQKKKEPCCCTGSWHCEGETNMVARTGSQEQGRGEGQGCHLIGRRAQISTCHQNCGLKSLTIRKQIHKVIRCNYREIIQGSNSTPLKKNTVLKLYKQTQECSRHLCVGKWMK